MIGPTPFINETMNLAIHGWDEGNNFILVMFLFF